MTRRWFLQILSAIPLLGFGCPALLAAQKRATPTTVVELYRAMNEAMPTGTSTFIQFAVTGEEYVEYAVGTFDVSDRAKAEARLCRWAWQTFIGNWWKSNTPKADVLYWRIKPEIAFYREDVEPFSGFDWKTSSSGGRKKARIYLRYLVSSKPARYTQEQLLDRPL